MSVELDFLLSITSGSPSGTSQTGSFALQRPRGNYLSCASRSVRRQWFHGGWKPDASAEQATSVGALAGLAGVARRVPHHAMLTITKGSGSSNNTMSLYLDGALDQHHRGHLRRGLSGRRRDVGRDDRKPRQRPIAPLMRVGEVRISNVARDAAYARAAYVTEGRGRADADTSQRISAEQLHAQRITALESCTRGHAEAVTKVGCYLELQARSA